MRSDRCESCSAGSLALNHDRQRSPASKAPLDRRIGGWIILYRPLKAGLGENMLIPAQKLPPVHAKSVEKSGSRDPRGDGHVPDRGSELLPLRLLRRPLIGITALALGGMVLWALQKACAGISFDAMVAALRATSPVALLGSLAATFLSFIALLGYDLSGLRYVGARPPFKVVLLASFCGFAIGNTVGLGAFSGGAVRYGLYSAAGLSPGQIARVIFFIAIAFGIGLATIAALGLVLRAGEVGGCWARRPYHCGRPRRPF